MKLPIGVSHFKKVIEEQYTFVDKSLFIKDIIDDVTEIVLITRPRRFGKTLNLSMLHYFLDLTHQGEKNLFSDLLISQAGTDYLKHQGQYPVIFLSFKDIKEKNFKDMLESFIVLLSNLYTQYRFLLEKNNLAPTEKIVYQSIMERKALLKDLKDSLKNLSRYLCDYYGVKTIILIDEYDSPLHAAFLNNHYKDTVDFMRGLLGSALKDNEYLHKAVLTGILRIAKESLFSGLNNLKVYTLMEERYSQYFGFTENEVDDLVQMAALTTHLSEIKIWYNGYQFGKSELYNPWSIINCLVEKGDLKPYWVNTSDNQLIKNLLTQSSEMFKEQFEKLLEGQSIKRFIDENTILIDMKQDISAAWSLLLMTGYLKFISKERTDDGLYCELSIPNQEVRNLYRQIIKQWLSNGFGMEWYNEFLETLLKGDIPAFERHLKQILEHNVSVHDISKNNEAFYHTFMLGLTASLHGNKNYVRTSNLESGYGRYDYMIYSKDPTRPSILIEFKQLQDEKKKTGDLDNLLKALAVLAKEAVQQMHEKKYSAEAERLGCQRIIKIGLAFCGKRFKLYAEEERLQ